MNNKEKKILFEKVKTIGLTKAVNAGACQEGYDNLVASKDFPSLLRVVRENARWCLDNGLLDSEFFELIPLPMLNEASIFHNQSTDSGIVIYDEAGCYQVGGNTFAFVEEWGIEVYASYESAVRARYDTEVIASGFSRVEAIERARVHARDSVAVWATDYAEVAASGRVSVTAEGNAKVTASGYCIVRASDQTRIYASDDVCVIREYMFGNNKTRVALSDRAVYLDPFNEKIKVAGKTIKTVKR